jgi:general stress protein 26
MGHDTDQIQKLGELIKEVKMAMLTTVEEDGSLHSRPMATTKAGFDGQLWFFTRDSSLKVDEIHKHVEVNVSYADPGKNTYVSISGKAQTIHDKGKATELWNPILKAWFPDGLEDPDLALLRVTAEKAEYWDSPSSKVVQLVGYVKAVTTGQTYKPSPGEHEKVTVS